MDDDRRAEEGGLQVIAVSCVLMAIFALFVPVHAFFEFAFSSGPVYGRDGSFAGQVKDLLGACIIGFGGLGICVAVRRLALKHLRLLRTQREDSAAAEDQKPE